MFRRILLISTLLLLPTVEAMANITVVGGWDPSIKHKTIAGSVEALHQPKGISFTLDKDNQEQVIKIDPNIHNLTLQASGFVGGWLTNSYCNVSKDIQNDGAMYGIVLKGAKAIKGEWTSCTLSIIRYKKENKPPKP